jgi:hypothetical protein
MEHIDIKIDFFVAINNVNKNYLFITEIQQLSHSPLKLGIKFKENKILD